MAPKLPTGSPFSRFWFEARRPLPLSTYGVLFTCLVLGGERPNRVKTPRSTLWGGGNSFLFSHQHLAFLCDTAPSVDTPPPLVRTYRILVTYHHLGGGGMVPHSGAGNPFLFFHQHLAFLCDTALASSIDTPPPLVRTYHILFTYHLR